ncbi:hypothetical protein ACHAWU_000300 [Discostella pseudostelligera]|uniref:Uncharacterized protein n=1 Tax=Discostella pseudostelligera TaxID=259834 RepID=A0ABD3ML16_9STRA
MTGPTAPLSYFNKVAHVTAGYHSPNVISRIACDETLLQVSRNDPSIVSLLVQIDDTDEDWYEKVGRPIGTSLHLRQLHLWSNSEMPDNFQSFCKLIAQNRSIEHFTMCHLNVTGIFSIFAPFFEHNKRLRSIEIVNCTIWEIDQLISALLLLKTSRLERINLDTNEIEALLVADFLNALNTNPGVHNLLDLCLRGNFIGLYECAALCNLLKNSSCKIECLDLGSNELTDECVDMLIIALIANRTVRYLDLTGQELVTTPAWCAFADFLSNCECSIESLFLGDNNIGNEGAISLGKSLANNKTLKHLDIGGCYDIRQRGWRGFSQCLRYPISELEALNLKDCSIDDDNLLDLVIPLTSSNARLKKLVVSSNERITWQGWLQFFRFWIHNDRPPLVEIDLSNSTIDDDGATLLVELVANHMTSLRTLIVLENPEITADGWRLFTDVLRPTATSKLKELRIGSGLTTETNVDDAFIIGFAHVLTTNTCLEKLEFDQVVSERGWNALTNAACDKSSIENIRCNSNHTLYEITCANGRPNDACYLFRMNFNENKSEVARQKILLHHFSDIDNLVQVFGPMAEAILPSAIAWIGRDRFGFSALYNLLRHKPSLIPKNTSSDDKRKRKREHAL